MNHHLDEMLYLADFSLLAESTALRIERVSELHQSRPMPTSAGAYRANFALLQRPDEKQKSSGRCKEKSSQPVSTSPLKSVTHSS